MAHPSLLESTGVVPPSQLAAVPPSVDDFRQGASLGRFMMVAVDANWLRHVDHRTCTYLANRVSGSVGHLRETRPTGDTTHDGQRKKLTDQQVQVPLTLVTDGWY